MFFFLEIRMLHVSFPVSESFDNPFLRAGVSSSTLVVVGCWLLVVGCWLLVVALYGGAIEPNSGTVRLRSLVMLLEPLGINEKLIRSSVFRLAKQGWLTSKK
ncbi:hypothetical protein [Pseudomonas sp. 2725]|jgi:hypothetical protein|uniref:hypothetical protein n=1 Tax=Pseudomonas sp. 2725 TaxID=3156449 RepID=UPI003D1DAA65